MKYISVTLSIFFIAILIAMIFIFPDMDKNKFNINDAAFEIESVMSGIREEIVAAAVQINGILSDPDKYENGLYNDQIYEFHDSVIYHNPIDQGHGKLYYSGVIPVLDRQKGKVKSMEYAIPLLKNLASDGKFSDYIVQAYCITSDSLFVFFPYTDLLAFLPPKRDITKMSTWKELKMDYPFKKHIWNTPYTDTIGKGYMIDICYPAYAYGELAALIACDITLKTIKRKLLSKYDEVLLIIANKTSDIVSMTSEAADFFMIKEAGDFRYLEPLNPAVNVYGLPEDLKLTTTRSVELKQLWQKLLEKDSFELIIDNKMNRVKSVKINETDWTLVHIEK